MSWYPAQNFSKCFRLLCRMLHTLLLDMSHTSACLFAHCLGLQLTDANTQAMFSGIQSEDGLPDGFLRDTATFMPLPYLLTDCILTWGFLLIQFTVKSTQSLCNGPHLNKQFHSTHILLTPQCSISNNFEAFVQTPICNDTLAQKHIIKIFKCFTISATPCTQFFIYCTVFIPLKMSTEQ
jgi:hypothetical protein